jgi:DNA mismatch repair protein MutL
VIACHASVRAGQRLSIQEMQEVVSQLKKCENPTTCPHGRPTIWKISKKELDKKFQRT